MGPHIVLYVLVASVAVVAFAAQSSPEQAVIENTGSTNSPGVKITVNPAGSAHVEPHGAEAHEANVDSELSQKLFDDLKAIGSLSKLPKAHCMKSASFGTSLYVKYNGETSPDLSCPVPPDSQLGLLKKDVQDLMQAAHATPRIGRRISAPATKPPQG